MITRDGTAILELTREQIVTRLQREARRRLGMSATEMVKRYRAGRLLDPGRVADLIALAHLLPDDDPFYIST